MKWLGPNETGYGHIPEPQPPAWLEYRCAVCGDAWEDHDETDRRDHLAEVRADDEANEP